MNYIVQFFDPQLMGVQREETTVSVAVDANDVVHAINKAANRLDGLPDKKGWKVLAVGPATAPVVDEFPR
jgi:hypothetical protein